MAIKFVTFRAALFGCALTALGGCATSSTPGAPPSLTDIISAIQADAVAACGFLPAASSVANILAAGVPALQVASSVATAICSAVTTKSARLKGSSPPMVAGVVIKGSFVK